LKLCFALHFALPQPADQVATFDEGLSGRVVLSDFKVRRKYSIQSWRSLAVLGAGLEFPMSSTTFHEPSFCFFQIDAYFP
jgi:hypothetical protein